MEKRDFELLAVYQIEDDEEMLPFESLYNLYAENTSDIIYITKDGILYGIICMGDVLYGHKKNDIVKINKSFTVLTGWNVIKAQEIFHRKKRINKIPVVNEQGKLLGDYSRWDDRLFIQRNRALLVQEEYVKKVLKPYKAVYAVEPAEKNNDCFRCLIKCFDEFQIEYKAIKKQQIVDKLLENAICIFQDEDERRSAECLCGIEPYLYDTYGKDITKFDLLADKSLHVRLATYKSLMLQILEQLEMGRLQIADSAERFLYGVNEKATVLFSALKKKGIRCICLYENEDEPTEYGKKFRKEAAERWNDSFYSIREPWPKKENNPKFFGELYQIEDYDNGTAQKEICDAHNVFGYKKDIIGKYFNAKGGRRITCFQPKECLGTIYFLGACVIVGAYAEDQYTIESCLQKKMLENGYKYRVENYSEPILPNAGIEYRLDEIEMFNSNDIVIYFSYAGKVVNAESISLEKIFEKNNIPSEWVKDSYIHCNHKANKLIADSLFEVIEPCIADKDGIGISIDIHDIMQSYIQNMYLDFYFSDFLPTEYKTIGAVVIAGAPFSIGHRYLIEQAKNMTEFLIIFVIEEETSIFPFEERFKMAVEGTKDLKDIMVVPSGNFVFSKHDNYIKQGDEAVEYNAKYHIEEFVNCIARPLHITHVFRGKEEKNKIVKVYNRVLEQTLPQKGIKYVELPKKEIGNEIISSYDIRKYLRDEEYDKAFALLPASTREYLTMQIDI